MKSLVLVGAAGIIVSVVTTIGMETELEVSNVNSEFSENRVEFYEENINYFDDSEILEIINFDEIFVEVDQEELKIEDIKVIELEEAIEIDFDTNKYLPYNFNSQEVSEDNISNYDTTEMNDLINYDEIFVEVDQEELRVENIKVIELEEAIEIDFDTFKFLPIGFNPNMK